MIAIEISCDPNPLYNEKPIINPTTMKKHLFPVIIAAMITVLSCTKPAEQKQALAAFDSLKSENIDLTHAVDLIYDFMNDPELKNIGQSWALGGTLPKDVFFTPTGNPTHGINMWFCFNNQDMDHPVFFMSVEKRDDFGHQFPNEPRPSDLVRPVDIFPYNGTIDRKAIRKYLVNTPEANHDTARPISQTAVKRYAHKFDSLLSRHLDATGQRRCEVPFSFFQNVNISFQGATTPILDAFVRQSGTTHVRYYFGYNPSENVNKIRVILFAVDENGKNIIAEDKNGGIIVQKSVPPTP